jgi:hypothetical protein
MGSAGSFLNPTKALLEAAKRGDMEAIKKLVKAPTDVNCSDEKGRTPLHEAAWWGRADAARALLEQGANVHAVTKRGWAPLHEAAERGHAGAVKVLLEHKANVHAVEKFGNTPLHLAASWGKVDAARVLLQHNADVHAVDKNGGTPLHEALRKGEADMTRVLLEHNANVHAVNKDGMTPMHMDSRAPGLIKAAQAALRAAKKPPTEPAFSLRPDTFYHATTEENALRIQEEGFVIPEGPGGLLGRGVYCTCTLAKAMDYLKGPHGGVVLELKINLGNCRQLVENDPMMTTWQEHYDSAWAPFSAANPADKGKEENCVKDPKKITVIQAIAGNTGKLRRGGFDIIGGKLRRVRGCTSPIPA